MNVRELVIPAAGTERGDGTNGVGQVHVDRHRNLSVVRRIRGGNDIRAVTTLIPKYEEDKHIFLEGMMKEGRRVFMQVDGGSDVSCILMEHVRALGLERKYLAVHTRPCYHCFTPDQPMPSVKLPCIPYCSWITQWNTE